LTYGNLSLYNYGFVWLARGKHNNEENISAQREKEEKQARLSQAHEQQRGKAYS
jgi:hypothetical protein